MRKNLLLTCTYLLVFAHVSAQIVSDQQKIKEGTYKPVQHFVFPKVDLDLKPSVAQSKVEREKYRNYIFNYAFTACIDNEFQLPIWVSHHVNHHLLIKNFTKRPASYPRDLQAGAIKTDAYASSGYDHGHLAPAADFTWSKIAYEQSHLMTNMSPQYACFNQKGWCHLEATVRRWVLNDTTSNAYIVSGAILEEFIDTLCVSTQLKIAVPKYFYKVVLVTSEQQDDFAIGFKIPNIDIPNNSVSDYQCSVREIERLTGLDFFTFLPRELQDSIEEDVPTVDFFQGTLDCPDKSCDATYKGRVKPAERTKCKCSVSTVKV